ncbi:MAG TPA: aromatic ring-hydroxylating dioxygenase subunit alpha [Gammaproteobacteria bacterium]|nr:aromatic ring-hydroxylating dioxygenase subunit alpha [Gammaproteobacteria bacterium]
MNDYSALVDIDRCTVSPRVFNDQDVYEAELEKIFTRTWNMVGHESQIPNANDYLTTFIGADPVLLTRDTKGKVRAFLNSCRHRGMRVCRRDHGNSKLFSCPYHGWTYDSSGKLRGVPQLENAYHNELDRGEWGLIELPHVESFRGLLFANFDPHCESLESYLGDMMWYLDLVLRRSKNGMIAFPGCHRWRLGGNWKLGAEQFGGDNYHTGALHRSMVEIGLGPEGDYRGSNPWTRDFEVKCVNGHGWINFDVEGVQPPPAQVTFFEQIRREAKETLSPAQADLVLTVQVGTVFPNMSILSFLGFTTVRVWHPRGPKEIHVQSYGLVEKDAPQEVRDLTRKAMGLTFSPSGIFEQDDGVAWGDIANVQGGPIRSQYPFNYQMGHGHGRTMDDKPGMIHPPSTEIGVFGLYEKWREMMAI